MISRLLVLLFCALSVVASAQNKTIKNKITLSAYHELAKHNSEDPIPVLIKGNVEQIEGFIRNSAGNVKFSTKSVVSANLTVADIRLLNKENFVELIDIPTAKLSMLNDVMVKHNNVDSAYLGMWPLDQGYDGSGVVIGVIDAPVDIDHQDFTDAEGNSRIKYVWDQNLTDGTPPVEYGYGIECDSAMIANGTCISNDYDEQNYSHGTGVAGVAASSGFASNQYRGVAPNADLIIVALNFNDNYLSKTIDAVSYIYDRAAAMNKPCVINTSYGSYAGSHDGNDLTTIALDELIEAQNGRAFVAAAGNAGNQLFHLGYDVIPTEQFTWFKKLSYTNMVYWQLWADTADFNHVNFRISADNPTGFASIGTTPVINMLADYNFETDIIDSLFYTIPGAGYVQTFVELIDDRYLIEFVIIPDVSTYYWRLSTSGTGHFDVWASEATTGFSNYVTTGLPDVGTVPEIINYRLPDTDQSIVSYWQCSDNVITVGNYVNRDTMTNYYGVIANFFDPVSDLYISSSHGPTRDNRLKPDICAPGCRVLAAGSTILTEWLISLDLATYISLDGQHYIYNGTSFASPEVAGIAALYMQKNPDAGFAEIKNAILSQARSDEFTGEDLPNNSWGYGKADAFRTLTGDWGCEADNYTDPPQNTELINVTATKALIAWDLIPNAAGYQISYHMVGGTTLKKKAFSNSKILTGLTPNSTYNCTIRAYCDTYGLSNWSETFLFNTLPLKEGMEENEMINMYPNPVSGFLHIDGISENTTIVVSNLTGNIMIKTQNVGPENILDMSELPAGLYHVAIYWEGNMYSKSITVIK